MSNQSNPLQVRIDRAAAKLAALKAQQQAREAREKVRRAREARATRNRALILWGIAVEREVLDAPSKIGVIRTMLEKHLTREGERAAALDFLDALRHAAPAQPEMASGQNRTSQQ
jgi:hypothetical protein